MASVNGLRNDLEAPGGRNDADAHPGQFQGVSYLRRAFNQGRGDFYGRAGQAVALGDGVACLRGGAGQRLAIAGDNGATRSHRRV